MDKFTIRTPDDFHVHLRCGEMMQAVLPFTAQVFGRALVMPNLSPQPITDTDRALGYQGLIDLECRKAGLSEGFEPLMTIQITDETTPEIIREARDAGVIAGKVYPKGVTTGSQNGVTEWGRLDEVFATMAKVGMVLSIHGQKPGTFCLSREEEFLGETLWPIVRGFDKLKIVLEHISTSLAAEAVSNMPANVAATITAHHLLLTLDDVLSYRSESGAEGLNPHHYCQPIPQWPTDRRNLIEAATSGNPKFFFGSDSAPHAKDRKEASCGCAGVFSAPVALPLLASVFEEAGCLKRLEDFVSRFGAEFYNLSLNEGTVTFKREEWQASSAYGGVVPLLAGRTLNWKCYRD